MTKFLLAYHGGGANPTSPEEGQAEMDRWMTWFGNLGAAVVDGGNPISRAWTVEAAGTTDNGGANPLSGYSILEAPSMDAALEMAKGCPVLVHGGSVELCETFDPMPQQG
jgi:hypothetical protein